MKPIDSRYLKGTGKYYVAIGKDSYGKKLFADGITITRFLAEAPKKNSLSSLGEQSKDQLVIYFDCKKSTPRGQSFVKGDRINYNNVNYEIREAQLHPTMETPHHWVLRLT